MGQVAKKKALVISQEMLETFYRREKQIAKIKESLAKAELLQEEDHTEILSLYNQGAKTESGVRIINIRIRKGRRSPHWKEIVEDIKGPKFVENIIANTEPSADKEIVEVM
jgi:predicted transcriptional regulator